VPRARPHGLVGGVEPPSAEFDCRLGFGSLVHGLDRLDVDQSVLTVGIRLIAWLEVTAENAGDSLDESF